LSNRMASPHYPVLGLPFRFRTLQLPSLMQSRFSRCIPLVPKYHSSSHDERVTRSRCGYVHIILSEEAGKIHSDCLVRLPSPRASPSRDRQASRRYRVHALTMAAMNVNGAKSNVAVDLRVRAVRVERSPASIPRIARQFKRPSSKMHGMYFMRDRISQTIAASH
jgi:hypothetical protein